MAQMNTPTTWDDGCRQAVKRLFSPEYEPHSMLSRLRHATDVLIERAQAEQEGDMIVEAARAIAREVPFIYAALYGEEYEVPIGLYVKKQADYGPENISRFGVFGVAVRLHDKVARLENLLTIAGQWESPQNESVSDTLDDVVGYCAILVMLIQGTFLLPVVGA